MYIGVFHPHNPFEVMTEERIQSIIAESVKQKVKLVFFNESGINLDQRTIDGSVYADGSWAKGTFPFPQSVMNIRPWGPRRRSDRELIFRKIVPFTAFLIDDKWKITKLISQSPSLSKFLVPTALLQNVDQIDELLKSHAKLVIKPVRGSRGEGVQALTHNGRLYELQRGAERIGMDRRELSEFVNNLKRQDYLIQPYIVCLTPDGEPFDFRILAQRNGEGKWVISVIYPRIGAKDTITSNVSVGGRTENLENFLMRLFPDHYLLFPQRLAEIGLEIADAINAHYAHPLNELGIDIAIDAEQRIWFYEANTCPGTLYHEKERAVQAIAYAKYVAEIASRNQASAKSGNNPKVTLGLLYSTHPSSRDLDAYADVAKAYGVQLVYFLLEDISFRAASISGFWRDGQKWIHKNYPFPDIVYNLIDQEYDEASNVLYHRSSNMLLTSSEPKGAIPSSLFFAIASRHPLLSNHLPYFLRPESPEEAKNFVDCHNPVVMKSESTLPMEDIIMIRRLPSHYAVRDGDYVHAFDEAEFLSFLELFQESNYILIQQIDSKTHDGHSLHLRVYLFKQADGTWEIIHIVPLLALVSPDPQGSLPFPVSWDWLLNREFDEMSGTEVDIHVQTLAVTMAEQLELANHHRIHELIIDVAMDRNRTIYLLGGEYDGPGETLHSYDTARLVIPYALSVLNVR
ncbi:YheC/YheD family protein [Paenibacillus thalictri]|uniref:ATP-grasp domain-containing protein n=1 Tax=Paenibacillus thalictri TaxID=2527873 RepID=A0A4Q9DQV6_9BACL|nr:YheC/YheD family protein [Paenibacillus thalictri]TBL77391.1 hypothetical protein EYB31_18120 [Paenibacillus thalictri]